MNPVTLKSSRHDIERLREREVFGDSHEKTAGKEARNYSWCLRCLCTNTQGIGNKQSQLRIIIPGVNMTISLKPCGWHSRLAPSDEIKPMPYSKEACLQSGEGDLCVL